MNVKTRLGDYELGTESIAAVLQQLQDHKMIGLGERRDVTLEVSRRVLEMSL